MKDKYGKEINKGDLLRNVMGPDKLLVLAVNKAAVTVQIKKHTFTMSQATLLKSPWSKI